MARGRLLIFVLVIAVSLPLCALGYGIYLFGRTGYETRVKIDDLYLQWVNCSDIQRIHDEALSKMGKFACPDGSVIAQVPGHKVVKYSVIDDDSISIEYGGGFVHYGVVIFKNDNDMAAELQRTKRPDVAKVVSRCVLFYEKPN